MRDTKVPAFPAKPLMRTDGPNTVAFLYADLARLNDREQEVVSKACFDYVKQGRLSIDLGKMFKERAPFADTKILDSITENFLTLTDLAQEREVKNGDMAKIRTMGAERFRAEKAAAKETDRGSDLPPTPDRTPEVARSPQLGGTMFKR